MRSDVSRRLEELSADNQTLRERVAELERELARFEEGPMTTLRESTSAREALLLEAERIAHMGTWVWDVPKGEVFWSPELYRILGYDPVREPASPEQFFARVHPDDRVRVRGHATTMAETGVPQRSDYRILRSDGRIRHVTTESALLFDAEGTLQRAVGTVLDVTEARAAAAELERTAARLAEAQRIGKMGSFEADVRTGKNEWSAELYELLGLDPGIEPSPEAFLERIHPEDAAKIGELIDAALHHGRTEPSHARVIGDDGVIRYVEMSAIPVFDEDGELSHIRGAVSDVTDVVRLREALAQSQKMQAVGQLAGGIAHDFNNLLTIIVGNLQLVLSRTDDPQLREIERAATAAARLTSRLLAFSRKSLLSPRVVDLTTDLAGAREIVERAIGERVATRFDVEDGLWPIHVDLGQVEQMILNLAVNARDAMPDGGKLDVSVRNVVLAEADARRLEALPGDYVVVEVRDTGKGMPAEVASRVFEPFFTTKEPGHGTGLGLAMVFGGMQQSGGFVDVDTVPGEGSRFRLWFPRTLERATEGPESLEPEPPPRARALLVEDNAAVARVVEQMMAQSGLDVRVVNAPSQALAELERESVELLVTDVVMPRMTGPELVAELRRNHPALRVLYITGYSEGHEGLDDQDEATMVLSKPFGVGELQKALAALLDG